MFICLIVLQFNIKISLIISLRMPAEPKDATASSMANNDKNAAPPSHHPSTV